MSNATGRFSTRWDPKRTKGRSDAQLQAITPGSEKLCSKSTQEADIANLERALANRPLKPPKRRAQ